MLRRGSFVAEIKGDQMQKDPTDDRRSSDHPYHLCSTIMLLGALLVFVAAPAAAAQFTVTKTTDSFDGVCDADCSLREAIQAANSAAGADEVVLPYGLYRLSLTGAGEDANATGDLDVSGELVIVGVGENETEIDGSFLSLGDRIFDIWTGPVEIRDLTINGGKALGAVGDQYGGGIRNRVDLTLRACTLSNNEATIGGGGVHTHAGSNLWAIDSNFVDNDAAQGGGINNWGGFVHLVNCEVLRNESGGVNSSGAGSPASGGGLIVEDSKIQSNNSTGNGGGINLNSAHAVILDSSTDSNHADSKGGGIYMSGSATLFVLRGTVSWNTATSDGGGLYAEDGTYVRGTIFRHNQGYSGGAIYSNGIPLVIEDSTFTQNSITGRLGGALYLRYGGEIIGSTFTLNEATANPTSGPSTGAAFVLNGGASASLIRSTVVNNTATSAAIACWGNLIVRGSAVVGNTGVSGVGGIGASTSCSADISGSIVANNLGGVDCQGLAYISSSGYNIESGISCGFTSPGDQQSTDPMVGLLGSYGGPTQTINLLTGSPAIDAGNPAGCDDGVGGLLSLDQRAYAREVDGDGNSSGICDIGPYEYASFPARIFKDGFETRDLGEWSPIDP